MSSVFTSINATVGRIRNAVFKNPSTGDYVYDDMIQPLMGKRLDSSSGKLDYDWANKGVSIADSTSITNDTHKLHYGYQVNHKFKLDGIVDFHIHWIQSQAAVPNWWIRYRLWQNGNPVTSWVEDKLSEGAFTYTSGTILAIHDATNEVDLNSVIPGGIDVSDFIDVELTRDSNNASGLFSGSDPVSGNVIVKGFDPHLQVDSNGSMLKWSK